MSLLSTHRQLLLAGILLTLALVVLILTSRSDGPDRLWYFDLNTRRLFAGPLTAAPPIAAPSGELRSTSEGGPAGVLAMVVMPADRSGIRIAYLQRFTSEAKELRQRQLHREQLSGDEESRIAGGIQVALPPTTLDEPVAWFDINSRNGEAITRQLKQVAGPDGWQLDLPGDH